MENASKALIMAGSVLLSILVIGSLVFMFNSLSGLKRIEASSEEVKKLAEYNKQIESFNKSGLYGSEIMSLANLIEDYNERQADLKGYSPIDLEIEIKSISLPKYFTKQKYDSKELISTYENLESTLNTNKNRIIYAGKTAMQISTMRDAELKKIIKEKETSWSDEKVDAKALSVKEEADSYYSDLKSELLQFKNKRFKTPTVEYDDNNGRITKMIFKENGD